MIEINETKPVEASLTIVLLGDDIEAFKAMIEKARNIYGYESFIADEIWEAINS